MFSLLVAFALAAAACSSDGDDGEATETSAVEASEGDDSSADSEDSSTDDANSDDGEAMEAAGEPILIGFQNPEGDPAGSFPEYAEGARAAAAYINAELGGLNGRPIELEVCPMAITPDESQRCANDLAAQGVEVAVSSLNFFGNHFPIYAGSDIPVIVGSPLTVGDFTSPNVYAIGSGGGCVGSHTGMMEFITQNLPDVTGNEIDRVSVAWYDVPPGLICYYDAQSKILDVINGNLPGDSELAGTNPDLVHTGVAVAPGAADLTAQATALLDFDPDVIAWGAPGPVCWALVDALARLGWSAEETPLVLSPPCLDLTLLEAAGDIANGVYISSTDNAVLAPLEDLTGQHLENASTYQTKGLEYGMSEDDLSKGFGGDGFSVMMNIWEISQDLDEVNGQTIGAAFAATDGSEPSFGGANLDCSGAVPPYATVCSTPIRLLQWNGSELVPVLDEPIVGLDLGAGTEILAGPYELN